jgi:hypothetical protein
MNSSNVIDLRVYRPGTVLPERTRLTSISFRPDRTAWVSLIDWLSAAIERCQRALGVIRTTEGLSADHALSSGWLARQFILADTLKAVLACRPGDEVTIGHAFFKLERELADQTTAA